jgi:hypothetical protein
MLALPKPAGPLTFETGKAPAAVEVV